MISGKQLEQALATRKQKRQREIAWLLYITEGYMANLTQASLNNLSSASAADAEIITWVIDQVGDFSAELRNHLNNISEGV